MLKHNQFGSTFEAVLYPVLLIIVLWLVFWADHLFPAIDFYKFGVKPGELSSFRGVFLMPLLHSKTEIGHIINNSPPTLILLGAIIYYYREIALKVFVFSWLLSGLGVWLFAANNNSFHIGISGVIYAMAAFLFVSGVLRKYLALQGISLFVAFVYGSMIWGIFPVKEHVSWEGHLAGMLVGVALAFIFRHKGPQTPKFLYEIEKEMGIEPPDLEGEWKEKVRLEQERIANLEREREAGNQPTNEVKIVYEYIERKIGDSEKPKE